MDISALETIIFVCSYENNDLATIDYLDVDNKILYATTKHNKKVFICFGGSKINYYFDEE